MKISIRRGVFETNSSSNHALMITDKDNLEKDKIEFKKEMNKGLFPCYGGFAKPITDKAEKAYFLAHLFDYDDKHYKSLSDDYRVFMSVLNDNNEEEILRTIRLNHEIYSKNRGWCYCRRYYDNDILDDCTCNFRKRFNEYFHNINLDLLDKYLDADEEARKNPIYDKIRKPKTLYEKIYDFLYDDGIIVPFEYM